VKVSLERELFAAFSAFSDTLQGICEESRSVDGKTKYLPHFMHVSR